MYVIDADGTDPRRLFKAVDTDAHPVWSPRGTLIAYGSDAGPVTGDEIAIFIVDADSGHLVRRITADATGDAQPGGRSRIRYSFSSLSW